MQPFLDQLRRALPWLTAVFVAAFGGTGVAVVIVDDDPSTPDRTVAIVDLHDILKKDEVLVPTPTGDVIADIDQQQQRDEMAHADERGEGVAIHEDAKDETPPGIDPQEIQADQELGAQRAEDVLKPGRPVGGAGAVNCQDRPVVNQSSLSSRRFGVALHFTVSPFGSINAIRGLFNTPSFGASSNYGFELISLECQRWVPESRKAWAQGAFNSAYVSIEIVTNDLNRAQWLQTPTFKTGRLAQLVREISIRNGTPLKHVDPEGCVPLAGITDHNALECGNTHWDVGPGFPWDVFMKQVKQGVRQPVLSSKERKIVKHARRPEGSGHSRRYWCRRLGTQIDWLNRSPKVERRGRRLAIQKRVWRATCR